MRAALFFLIAVLACGQNFDVILANGKIVDGTGNGWYYGDIGIRGDRIARISPPGGLDKASARLRLSAKALVVAPGFIDIQSHSRDAFLSGDGRVLSKITQGITTEIMGEGFTNAPVNDRILQLMPSLGRGSGGDPLRFAGPRGFDTWLRAMEAHGASPNFGSFVGATSLRMYVKGMDQGAASPAEVDTMQRLVKNAMEDGAFGIASALIYPPGIYAGTEELVAISKAMAPYGGVYISHIRSEAGQFLEAIDEAIDIGRRAGVPIEIYHLKSGGRRNWPKTALALRKINEARASGQDVSADMYSYIAGATGLTACLPPASAEGGKLFDRLADPAERAKIKAEALREGADWEQMCTLAGPEGVLIVGVDKPENKRWEGKRLSEIAREQGKDPLDTAMDLILSEHRRVETVYFMMSEDNVKLQLRQPWIKFGTDAGGVDPGNVKELAHPRAYGNYPRILGKYVREEKVLPLEDAIRKMSSSVAGRLSIRDRGLLQEGFKADIVVFNENTIADRATFEKPHQLSVGMVHVLVNGIPVIQDGRHTGAKPGRIVRGAGWTGSPAN